MKYYEHYLKRLRESVARGPMAEQLLPLLDLVDELDRPAEQRFQMVQELERLIRDLGGSDVDWSAVRPDTVYIEGRRVYGEK